MTGTGDEPSSDGARGKIPAAANVRPRRLGGLSEKEVIQ